MSIVIRKAKLSEEIACNVLAKRSVYTRDFQNPPLSLKAMRAVAFTQKQVYVAVEGNKVVGFLWSRPMVAKHMKFCTAYYSAVDNVAVIGLGSVNRRFLIQALADSPFGRVEWVCEHGNEATHRYYVRASQIPNFFGSGVVCSQVREGAVGKDKRPYTRWSIQK